jgi:tryptophan synthase beta subunit
MEKCNVADPPVFWDDVIAIGLQNWRKKTLLAYVCRLAFGATIYHIWRNRNEIRHGGLHKTEVQILQQILCCKWGFHKGVLV